MPYGGLGYALSYAQCNMVYLLIDQIFINSQKHKCEMRGYLGTLKLMGSTFGYGTRIPFQIEHFLYFYT